MTTRTTTGLGSGLRAAFGIILLLAGSTAALATVAGFFGSLWWGFDLAADYRFVYLTVAVVCAVLYGLTFGRGMAAVFAAAAVVNAFVVAPLWLASQPRPATDTGVTLATYNAQRKAGTQDRIVEWLRREPADIVVIQETTSAWTPVFERAELPYRIVLAPEERVVFGTTILAKVEASAKETEIVATKVIEMEATVDGVPVVVYVAHPRRPGSAVEADARLRLFAALADLAAERAGPTIVAGDLGTTRWSHAFATLTADGVLRSSEDGFGYQPTWPTMSWPIVGRYAGIPVDHVLLSPGLTASERRVGPQLGTDHLPVVVDVRPAG